MRMCSIHYTGQISSMNVCEVNDEDSPWQAPIHGSTHLQFLNSFPHCNYDLPLFGNTLQTAAFFLLLSNRKQEANRKTGRKLGSGVANPEGNVPNPTRLYEEQGPCKLGSGRSGRMSIGHLGVPIQPAYHIFISINISVTSVLMLDVYIPGVPFF